MYYPYVSSSTKLLGTNLQITISFGSEPSSGKYEDLQFMQRKKKTKHLVHYSKITSKNHTMAWELHTLIPSF